MHLPPAVYAASTEANLRINLCMRKTMLWRNSALVPEI
jgi:hypothetical protein